MQLADELGLDEAKFLRVLVVAALLRADRITEDEAYPNRLVGEDEESDSI